MSPALSITRFSDSSSSISFTIGLSIFGFPGLPRSMKKMRLFGFVPSDT